MTYLIIPLIMICNMLRGMDSVGKIPASLLIILGMLPFYPWEVAVWSGIGFFIWSVPAWWPKDRVEDGVTYQGNWSAARPLNWFQTFYVKNSINPKESYITWYVPSWYGWTILRQFAIIPLFVGLAVCANYALTGLWQLSSNPWQLLYSLLPILSWGALMYVLSPNCLNVKHHTVWHEVLFGGIMGLSIWLSWFTI